MKRAKVIAAGAAIALLGTFATSADAQMIGIGTTKGTVVDQMTAAISKVVSEHSGLQMRTQAMGGTQQYLPVVNAGQLEFGIGNSFQTYQAVKGVGLSQGRLHENLRMVATLVPFNSGLIVTAKSGMRKVADVKGKRIAYGFKSAPLFQIFMEGYLANGGLTFKDVEHVQAIALRQSWELLMQGKLEVVIGAPGGAPNREMETRIDGGIRYIDFDTTGPNAQKTLDILTTTYYERLEPSSQLPAIKGPTTIMGYDFMLWTSKSVSDDIVMKVVKALYEHPGDLKAASPVWRKFDSKKMGKNQGPLEYHPAAIAFYKKMGAWNR